MAAPRNGFPARKRTSLGNQVIPVHYPTAYDRFDDMKRNRWIDDLQRKIRNGMNQPASPGPSRSPSPLHHPNRSLQADGEGAEEDGLAEDDQQGLDVEVNAFHDSSSPVRRLEDEEGFEDVVADEENVPQGQLPQGIDQQQVLRYAAGYVTGDAVEPELADVDGEMDENEVYQAEGDGWEEDDEEEEEEEEDDEEEEQLDQDSEKSQVEVAYVGSSEEEQEEEEDWQEEAEYEERDELEHDSGELLDPGPADVMEDLQAQLHSDAALQSFAPTSILPAHFQQPSNLPVSTSAAVYLSLPQVGASVFQAPSSTAMVQRQAQAHDDWPETGPASVPAEMIDPSLLTALAQQVMGATGTGIYPELSVETMNQVLQESHDQQEQVILQNVQHFDAEPDLDEEQWGYVAFARAEGDAEVEQADDSEEQEEVEDEHFGLWLRWPTESPHS